MLANHVLESALRQLVHNYHEFPERDSCTVLVIADPEGLAPMSGAGKMTLTRTDNGFTITYERTT